MKGEVTSAKCWLWSVKRSVISFGFAVQRVHAPTLQLAADKLRKALEADVVFQTHAEWVRVHTRTKASYSAWTKMQRKGAAIEPSAAAVAADTCVGATKMASLGSDGGSGRAVASSLPAMG